MREDLELIKTQYIKQSLSLINKYDKLNIIYLRVSTKNEGQEEGDQINDVLSVFNLKEEECLIIKAKESAFQEKKQKYRILEVIKEIIKELKDDEKVLYVWDLDRIYRNQDMQVEFIQKCFKLNCKVLSYRQKWLYKLRESGGMGKALYNFMIEVFGYMAEEESKKKGERLKKSLNIKDGRLYTNKGNLFGKKYKNKNGKIIKDIKKINNIEKSILKKIKQGMKYRDIIKLVEDKTNLKISLGQITNIKNKYV